MRGLRRYAPTTPNRRVPSIVVMGLCHDDRMINADTEYYAFMPQWVLRRTVFRKIPITGGGRQQVNRFTLHLDGCEHYCTQVTIVSEQLHRYDGNRSWSLVHIVACSLFNSKPLPKPLLTDYWLDSQECISKIFYSKFQRLFLDAFQILCLWNNTELVETSVCTKLQNWQQGTILRVCLNT